MYLTIALRKEVDTFEQAQTLLDVVSEKLKDHPEVQISGSVSEQLTVTPPG